MVYYEISTVERHPSSSSSSSTSVVSKHVKIIGLFNAEASFNILDPANECHGYDIKQSDSEVPVILELREKQSNPSLPSRPGPLQAGVVAPDRALSMG